MRDTALIQKIKDFQDSLMFREQKIKELSEEINRDLEVFIIENTGNISVGDLVQDVDGIKYSVSYIGQGYVRTFKLKTNGSVSTQPGRFIYYWNCWEFKKVTYYKV